MRHTPGPWEIDHNEEDFPTIWGIWGYSCPSHEEICIATCEREQYGCEEEEDSLADREETIANATLISNAPELLDACKSIRKLLEEGTIDAEFDGKWLQEVIEKAEGRQNRFLPTRERR